MKRLVLGVLLLLTSLSCTNADKSEPSIGASRPSKTASPEDDPPQLLSGDEWLSFGTKQRNAWVEGYVTGYLSGKNDACSAADKINPIPNAQPGYKGHPSEFLSAKCIAMVDKYDRFLGLTPDCHWSGPHPEIYSTVITNFYELNPAYRGLQYPTLMRFLSDGKAKTETELLSIVKASKLQPGR